MYKYIKNDKFIKVIAIFGFISIIQVLMIIIKTPPARGYELSIYDAYPWYLWLFIFSSTASGILILLYQIFEQNSNRWLIGFYIIILSNAIILGLPFFRGYFLYPTGDALTHLGAMKEIIYTGYIGKNNFYPMVHILGVGLLDITGLSNGSIINLLFVIWSLIYLLNFYLLTIAITNNRGQSLLILAIASPLVFSYLHTLIHPSMFSLFMVPLILYFYHRREKFLREKLLILLLAFMIVFTHPITAIFMIVIFLTFIISNVIYKQVIIRKQGIIHINLKRSNSSTVISYNISKIMIVTFFIWYFSYAFIQSSFVKVFDFLTRKSEVSVVNQQINLLADAQLSTSQFVELFTYKYGAVFLYLFISIIAVVIVLKWSLDKKTDLDKTTFDYAIQFTVAIIFSAFSLFGFTGEYNPLRISRFFLVIGPIVTGLAFFRFINEDSQNKVNVFKKKISVIIITFVILSVALLSILNVYGSPRVAEANWQVSIMEVKGIEWFVNYQNKDIITTTVGINIRRFEDLIFGNEYNNSDRMQWDSKTIESHFGYYDNSSVAETFNFKDRYLLITKADTVRVNIIPENIRYKAHQYTEDDFVRLGADPTAIRIYTNNELNIWKIYGNLIRF